VLCTAIIGAAVGAIVGAVGYTAYTIASGNEFNAGHMLLAAGGGAVAGALIGTGVGIAAGMSAAAATSTAVTGASAATTTVLSATGRDPTDEASAIAKAAQGFSTASAQTLGRAGETIAGIVKNTKSIPSLTRTANYRIPDQWLKATKLISEVKNVDRLSLTNQIKDFVAYAQLEGYTFELWVRETTKITKPLQELIDDGQIILRYLEAK